MTPEEIALVRIKALKEHQESLVKNGYKDFFTGKKVEAKDITLPDEPVAPKKPEEIAEKVAAVYAKSKADQESALAKNPAPESKAKAKK